MDLGISLNSLQIILMIISLYYLSRQLPRGTRRVVTTLRWGLTRTWDVGDKDAARKIESYRRFAYIVFLSVAMQITPQNYKESTTEVQESKKTNT